MTASIGLVRRRLIVNHHNAELAHEILEEARSEAEADLNNVVPFPLHHSEEMQ